MSRSSLVAATTVVLVVLYSIASRSHDVSMMDFVPEPATQPLDTAQDPNPEGDPHPEGGTAASSLPNTQSFDDTASRSAPVTTHFRSAPQRHNRTAPWFDRGRRAASDGIYHDTPIRAQESRPLDPHANVSSDADVLQQHEVSEWQPHWVLRHPATRWSLSREATPSKDLPTETLEEYEMKQQRFLRSTQRPAVLGDLEFITSVKPLYLYTRPRAEERWQRLESEAKSPVVRIACLYAGFTRDAVNMFLACRDRKSERLCLTKTVRKLYGHQRDNIIRPTQCDVFASTWNIVGAGNYGTTRYDMRSMFDPQTLHQLYGEQLAGLHVQNISEYQQLWRYMHKFSRPFPQTRPTKLHVNRHTGDSSFEGSPELNFFIRINDYSQSYKHWCVAHLALLSSVGYDLFFRLRFDLRAQAKLFGFSLAVAPEGSPEQDAHVGPNRHVVTFRLSKGAAAQLPPQRYVSSRRIHMNNFDIADFGFLGPPFMIEELSQLWYYCLAAPGTPLAPAPWIDVVTQKSRFSEYNLMLWRIVFDNQWSVDSGGRYLWVSRFGVGRKTK